MKGTIIRKGIALLAAVAAVVSLAACGSASATSDQQTVKVGIRGGAGKIWAAVKTELAKQNIKLDFKEYDSSVNLNDLLLAGDIDINAAQHYAALDYFKSKNKRYDDLVAAGQLRLITIDLYSRKYQSVDDLPDGATIAIPNDPMNAGRAFSVLASSGVITLGDYQWLPTQKDITANPKHLKFKEIASSTMVRTLDDVDAGFVYSQEATAGGLDTQNGPIVKDKIDLKNNKVQHDFIVIMTVRKADKDKKIYQTVLDAYHSPAVYKVIKDVYKGAVYPVENDEVVDLSKY